MVEKFDNKNSIIHIQTKYNDLLEERKNRISIIRQEFVQTKVTVFV